MHSKSSGFGFSTKSEIDNSHFTYNLLPMRINSHIFKIINELKMTEIPILLQLYPSDHANEIKKLKEISEKISALRSLSSMIFESIHNNKKVLSVSIKSVLKWQEKLLKICSYYCDLLLFRKEKKFKLAAINSEELIKLIVSFKKNQFSEFNKILVKNILVSALVHKAKIHRCLAGYDLENLEMNQLNLSKISYELAYIIKPDYQILICLGFLLNDMALNSSPLEGELILNQALKHHEEAKMFDVNNPNANHGIGLDCYKLLKLEKENNKNLSKKLIEKAHESFSVTEKYNPNARLFYDRGLLHLLEGNENKALAEFDRGLLIDPNHILLLQERAYLYLKNKKYTLALKDFNLGLMLSVCSESMKKKFSSGILKVKKEYSVVEEKENLRKNINISSEIPFSIHSVAVHAEYLKILKKFSELNSAKEPIKVFISYAWGNKEHEKLVDDIVEELTISGFHMVYDRNEDFKGKILWSFLNKMLDVDYIIAVGTLEYRRKCDFRTKSGEREHVVAAEAALISYLVGHSQEKSNRVIPLLVEGPAEKAFPPALLPKLPVDLWKQDRYCEMFCLVATMYKISYRDQKFMSLTEEFTKKRQEITMMTAKAVSAKYHTDIRKAIHHTVFGSRNNTGLQETEPSLLKKLTSKM